MRKKIFFGFLIALLVLLVPCMAFAHSGRTDSAGGHHDYQNKSGLGSYHYHHGYGPHLHPNGVCPYAEIYNTGSTGSGSSDAAQNNSSVVQPKPQKITKQAYAQVITIACTGYYWNFDLDEEAYGNDLAIWTAQTYNIDGYNYIKLRDLAYSIVFIFLIAAIITAARPPLLPVQLFCRTDPPLPPISYNSTSLWGFCRPSR